MIVPLIHSEEFFERSRHPALSPPSRAFQKIPREGRSWEAGRALTPGLLGEQSPPFPTPRPVFSLGWGGGAGRRGIQARRGYKRKGNWRGLWLPRQRHCWGQWRLLGREERGVSLLALCFILPVLMLFVKSRLSLPLCLGVGVGGHCRDPFCLAVLTFPPSYLPVCCSFPYSQLLASHLPFCLPRPAT